MAKKQIKEKTTKKSTKPVDSETKAEVKSTTTSTKEKSQAIPTHARSQKYQAAKAKVDSTKSYPLSDAVKLVQQVSISSFDGKIEAHLKVKASPGTIGNVKFPHLKTEAKKIVIVDDKVVENIKNGKIDFDILLATPQTMPKLLPLARILGPKGLMPNPKNGTLTPDPQKAMEKFAVDEVSIKTEKKAPLIHLVVGQVSQPTAEIVANLEELIKLITPAKIDKLVLAPTMGPAVKVATG